MINYGSKETDKPALFTLLFSLLTSAVGLIALLGWILGIPLLASFNSDFIPMAPSTAFLFISFGVAILFSARFPKTSRFYKAGIIICSIGTLISLLLFFLSSFGIHPAVEHSWFKIEGSISGAPLGHISPLTSLCFVFAGLSFLISLSPERQKLMLVSLSSAFLIVLGSIILLLAHLFGMPLLYGTQFIPPALSTSLALFFLGIALIALISPKIWQYKSETDAASTRSSIILISVFVVLASGIISAGYFYYIHNEKEFRLEKGQELSSVAELKTSELIHIRKEWVADASLFYENAFFSTLVDRYFNNPKDIEAYWQLRIWLSHFRAVNEYNKVSLLDANGIERFAEPDSLKLHSSAYKEKFSEAVKSGKITIVDFYRNEYDQHIYLNILVPISDPKNNNRIIGVLSLRIDPESYLYPYIKSWPTPSKTSETILVRREGDDVLFLNEVKLKQNTALSFRIFLQKKHFPAVKAVQGEEGIVEGYDYKDVPVLADIHHIPNSPWSLVTKIDIAEVYAPLYERLWMMIFLITALLFGSGTSVAVVWRHQHARFYLERFQSAKTLRDSYELLEKVFNNTHIMMAYLDPKFNFIRVNQAYAEADEHTPDFYTGKNHFALFPYAENETLFRNVVDTGQTLTVFAKPFEYAEHPERGISYWDWSLQPVKASDGSVTALVFSLINVTKHMQSQELIQKLNRVYAVLSNINQAIVRIHDINQLFNGICRIAVEDGKFRMVWIGMINPQTNMVDVVASAGLTEDYLNKIKIDLNDKKQTEGPTLKTLRYGHYTISNDIATDENMLPWREEALKLGYRSSASLPIKVLGTVRGVIKLYSDEVEFFAEDEIKLLDEMAMDVSFALEFIEHEAKRKQAEEFLLKFRLGVERSGDAVLLTDPDGTIVYVNPAFENIFGYTKEETVGKTPRILKSGTLNQEYYKNFWNDLLTKKAVTHEIINKTKDGRLLSIEASVNPIISEHGEIIGHLAIERDITERKRAEKEIKEHAEQYRTILSATLFGFWLVDEKGKLLDVNDTYCSMSGYTREELLNLSISDLEVIDKPEDVARRIQKIIETGTDQFESKHKAKDGQVIDVEISTGFLYSQKQFIVFIRDITDRKHAEEELHKNRELLLTMLNNMPITIFATDSRGIFTLSEGMGLKRVGLKPGENVGVSAFDLYGSFPFVEHTGKVTAGKDVVRRALAGETVTAFTDLRGVHFENHIGPLRGADGNVVGIVGMAIDITERKRSDQLQNAVYQIAQAADKNETLYDLYKSVHEIISTIMPAKNFYISLYDEIQNLISFPYFVDEFDVPLPPSKPRRGLTEYVLRTSKPLFCDEATDKKLRKSGEVELVGEASAIWLGVPLIVGDKTIGAMVVQHYSDSKAYSESDLQILEYVSSQVARTIERRRAEDEVISQKNKFAQLFESSPIAIVLLDDQDKVVHINESFSILFGYFLEEIKGKFINDLIVPSELKEEAKTYSDETHGGGQISNESYRQRKNGSIVYVQIVGVPVTVNDLMVGIYGMYVDLTERKDAEEKMKIAKELAEQSDKLKSEFLAQMSHEIRTPINIMAGNVDYLKDIFSEKMDADAGECFDGIDLASKRIIRTVDLILNVAELQTSGYNPYKVKVDLNSEILNKLYKEHQLSAKQKGLELIYTCKLKDSKVLADVYSVTQIFANLIDNAIKYTKKGKVEILLGKNRTDNIMVMVKDTGIGMSKEFLSRMFEPFVQEEQGFTRAYDGNGLGLTLVKNYCDINNALLEVQSEKNVGSTFSVTFRS